MIPHQNIVLAFSICASINLRVGWENISLIVHGFKIARMVHDMPGNEATCRCVPGQC